MKKNNILSCALPLFISIIGCIYILSGGKPLLIVSEDSSFHFNLITVNALFGGFLYTNYSLLLGVLDNAIVSKIKNTDIISKRNAHILKGIVYATVSVVAGLFIVLMPPQNSYIFLVVKCFMQNIEIVFMAFLILYFLRSLKEMSELVGVLHNDGKNRKTPEEICKLKDKLRNMHSK